MTQMDRAAPDLSWGAWSEELRQVPLDAQMAQLREENNGLRRAMKTHGAIDMARGTIMLVGPCSPEQAWQVLVEVSQHTNIKLHHIAQRLVDSTTGPPPSKPLRDALGEALARLRAEGGGVADGTAEPGPPCGHVGHR